MEEGVSDDDADRLLALARAAAERAYVPYSTFRVGAAVMAGGRTYAGCNVAVTRRGRCCVER